MYVWRMVSYAKAGKRSAALSVIKKRMEAWPKSARIRYLSAVTGDHSGGVLVTEVEAESLDGLYELGAKLSTTPEDKALAEEWNALLERGTSHEIYQVS